MKVYPSDDGVPKMIKILIVLKIYMQAVFNSYLHLHRDNFIGSLDLLIRQQNSKVNFLYNIEFSSDNDSHKVSDSSCNAVESLVFFFEVRELKLVGFVLSENACRFQFLGEGSKLSGKILIRINF